MNSDNDHLNPATPLRGEKSILAALLLWFVIASFLPDLLWPSRKCYFAVANESFQCFTTLHPVPWKEWHCLGGSGQEDTSLPYMALLRLVYAVAGDRILSLRIVSVLAALLTLYLFYRTARRLFSPAPALIFLFLLVTSPIYLESMRAFGYQSLSHLAVALAVWLLVSSLSARPAALKTAALGATAVATLSLYIAVRIVVLLPVLFFLVYLRTEWRKLLLYLATFVGLVVLLEGLRGEKLFNFPYYFYNPPEPGAEWVIDEGRFSPPMLKDHICANLGAARDYLLGRDRVPFADRDPRSRIMNAFYAPFLLLGILVCLRRRGRGSALILILLLLYFVAPLASSALHPRRILLALYPLNLLIALGLSLCYVRLRRVLPSLSLALCIAVIGLADLHEYLFSVASPVLAFTREQLQKVSAVLTPLRRSVDWIRFHKAINEVTLGNPYFAPKPTSAARSAQMFGEETIDPRWNLTLFMPEGLNLLYLYTVPASPQVADALDFARGKLKGLASEIAVAGTELRGILVRWNTVAPNLLSRPGTARIASSPNLSVVNRPLRPYQNEHLHYGLVDLNPATSWEIVLDRGRGPGWVMFDHGEGMSSIARSISIRPALGKREGFFRSADLMGSSDGVGWEHLDRMEPGGPPPSGGWINWSFRNDRPWRCYRLFIRPGNWSSETEVISLGDLMLFDAAPRAFQIETLL